MTHQYFTIKETAFMLKMHPESLRRICRKKPAPIAHGWAGKRIVFTQDQIDGYVNRRKPGAIAAAVGKKLAKG